MDALNSFVSAISTVGFPCVICLIMIDIIRKIEENHKSEMHEMTEAVNNNTTALVKLIDKIENWEHKNG